MGKNKINSIGSETIKLTASKSITLIVTMLSAVVLSRLLSLREYGTYSQILLITDLSTTVLLFGLPNSLNYFLAQSDDFEEQRNFLSIFYSLSTLLSLAIGFLLVLLLPVIKNQFSNDYLVEFAYFMLVFPWTRIISNSISNVLVIFKKTSLLLVYKLSTSFAILLLILLTVVFDLEFTVYMKLFLFVQVIFTLCVYIIVNKYLMKIKVMFNFNYIKRILTFSIPIGLASVVGTINIKLDKLMISKVLDTEQLAIYENASREIPITIIATSLVAILLPQMVRLLKEKKVDKAIKLWGSSIILSYFIICFLSIALFVFATDVMTLLYSEKYVSGTNVFRIYSILLLLRVTYFGMIINAKGETKFIFFSSLISLLLNIILNILLYKYIGFIGPAIATLISQLIINLSQLYFTSKLLNINLRVIFPWKQLGYITCLNIALGILFTFLKSLIAVDLLFGSILESFILGCVWFIIYFMILKREVKIQWRKLNEGEEYV